MQKVSFLKLQTNDTHFINYKYLSRLVVNTRSMEKNLKSERKVLELKKQFLIKNCNVKLEQLDNDNEQLAKQIKVDTPQIAEKSIENSSKQMNNFLAELKKMSQ